MEKKSTVALNTTCFKGNDLILHLNERRTLYSRFRKTSCSFAGIMPFFPTGNREEEKSLNFKMHALLSFLSFFLKLRCVHRKLTCILQCTVFSFHIHPKILGTIHLVPLVPLKREDFHSDLPHSGPSLASHQPVGVEGTGDVSAITLNQ